MKTKTIRDKMFPGHLMIHFIENGRVVFSDGLQRYSDRLGTYYKSDTITNMFNTITQAKEYWIKKLNKGEINE